MAFPNARHLLGSIALLLAAFPSAQAVPLGTAFTYQGRLQDGQQLANGLYDFEFRLHDQDAPGAVIAGPIMLDDIPVENGVFSVSLDFGALFDGQARWLAISVREGASVGAFDLLSPRQPLTAAPYALHALSGNPGPQGPAGPQGASGVVQTSAFAGQVAASIAAGGFNAPWVFVGPTTTIAVTANQRLVGSAVAVIGTTSNSATPISFSLCYQPGGQGELLSFLGSNFTDGNTVPNAGTALPAAASVQLPNAGSYVVGYCVKNKSTTLALTNNDFVNGWVMVLD